MKTGSCNYQPNGFIPYKNNSGQVLFNIERNDKVVDGQTEENWDFNYAEVINQERSTIINAVIREKYSQADAEGLLADYAKGENMVEYLRFQNWREVAKAVADGKHLKSELAYLYAKKIIEVSIPFSDTLEGGKYASLADRILKVKSPSNVDIADNRVYVYVAFILPDDLTVLEADENVIIIEYSGIE